MKSLLIVVSLFFITTSLFANEQCKSCTELAALKKEAAIMVKSKKDTAKTDVKAIQLINKMGVKKNSLNDEQAKIVVEYLAVSLPADPSRSLIEAIWPTVKNNQAKIQSAAKNLAEKDKKEVVSSIKNYELMLKEGNDPKTK